MVNVGEQISRVVDKELEDVEKHCIRPLQVEAFQCCRNCCLDQVSPQERVQQCIQHCMKPLADTEQFVSQEMEKFQGRFTRCGEQCADDVRDSNKPKADVLQQYQKCVLGCVDKHIDMVPSLMSRIKKNFKTC